jgi:ribosomal protein L40E
MANKCMNCKADLREGAKFCQACGTKVPLKQKSKITQAKFCIKCGAPLKKGAKFCTKCGAETVKKKTADLNIYVDEPVISVSVSNQPPVEDIKEKPPTVEIIDQAREGKKIRQRPPKQIPQANKNYRDTDVEIDKSSKETKNYVEDKIKKQAANLGKKALTNLLNQTLSASDTAGEMRIPMNDAQKSCLIDVISELTKMLGR